MRFIVVCMLLLLSACVSYREPGGGVMKVTSNAFKEGNSIPKMYTCQGNNINPQLAWSNTPKDTKSFALIMDDPDAPSGLFTHWLVKNIPPNVMEIPEDTSPDGIEVPNSAQNASYIGPCPPSGMHRYFFKVYALDVEELPSDTKEEFYAGVEEHEIGHGVLIGLFAKK